MANDPPEHWGWRIFPWVFWIGVGLAALIVEGTDLQGSWKAAGYFGGAAFIYLMLQSIIVEPLKNQIQRLEYKIDRLQRLVRPDLDYDE
jgi:hypothetical protein